MKLAFLKKKLLTICFLLVSISPNAASKEMLQDCLELPFNGLNLIEECGGYEVTGGGSCYAYLQDAIDSDLKKKLSQKLIIPRNEQRSLMCAPQREGDEISLLYHHSIKYGLLTEDDWFRFAQSSENEYLKFTILLTLALEANDESFVYFRDWIQDDVGQLPEDLRMIIGLVGTDLMVSELIKSIKKFGYPLHRAGTQDLSYEQHPVWTEFLCNYYPKVRSVSRLIFGKGAPDDFGIADRFNELRKVRLDVEMLDACEFWY